jgi:hypothetical protein
MAADASSWVFSINPGSSAIFFSPASISADKFLSSVSSAVFLAIYNSRVDCRLVNISLLLSIWACDPFTACSALAFFYSTAGQEDWLFKARLITT